MSKNNPRGRVGKPKGSPASPASFKKGETGNPNGRPKGVISFATMLRRQYEDDAEKDSTRVYTLLFEAIEAKEGWAHQLFWKDIMPKKVRTVLIDTSTNRLEGLVKGLDKFVELTHAEIVEEIKALSSVKTAEKIEAARKLLSAEDEAQMLAEIDFIIAEAHSMKNKGN